MINLMEGDCLELMKDIPDKSIDMILCDLPYGTTACKWDVKIPFDELWGQYNRIIKDNACTALFGSEPFSSYLRMSNIKNYKYDWVWNKKLSGSFQNAKYQPLKIIELISVFGNRINYHPIMRKGKERYKGHKEKSKKSNSGVCSGLVKSAPYVLYDEYFPVCLLEFGNTNKKDIIHPTQKPVSLLEYLIKTYTLENQTVLDNCMGSGSTGVACINTNRNFIGMEKNKTFFEIAKKRIEQAKDLFYESNDA
jgi:DNA modification methylase